jgi:hypothetical protein
MEALLVKFSGKIDVKSVEKCYNEIREKYLKDGVQKSDLPPIVTRLMLEAAKFKKLKGSEKRELVIDIIEKIIEDIEPGDKDTEFEMVLKTLVPSMVDSFEALLKVNKALCCLK